MTDTREPECSLGRILVVPMNEVDQSGRRLLNYLLYII